ncbi:MAG: glycogen debranching protein GlgX, partial [Anaerolineaceae bacterium]|nr:glycogen debranching protein GlgX [Anaerolineaceae bacterium]
AGSTGVDLLLFNQVDDNIPSRIISLDPGRNRTFHYWHVFVPGIKSDQLYAYRVAGPYQPDAGLRFDPSKILLDPYGRGIVFPSGYDRGAACRLGEETAGTAPKSVVVDANDYDWQGDLPLHHPFAQTVIYEMHVAGFTRHPASGVSEEKRGTYAGLVEKIPYLKDLGITAVELLPVYAFDPWDAPGGKVNYWGYSPMAFFAPHPFYSSRKEGLGPLDEFRDMVKALHRAGIEVILDVVYNHTTEGGESGPTLSFRGLDNGAYYILEPDPRYYSNYTGCGNTLNANNPVVRRMILDSLRYWVAEMHIDGFRFDLASILSRDEDGAPLANPPILLDIETDPYLSGTKLIAEAWDAAGLYQVGSFVGERWKEWNGKFRDDIRSWVRGDRGAISHFPSRILGSPDIFEHENREPEQSINFVSCHDGFTLNDVVSYNQKHNDANGEDNRDGANNNYSSNHGVEGATNDSVVENIRERQVKNLSAYVLLSIGTPMLQMGDEIRRTQSGNNNAYSQDSELSWFDWTKVEEKAGLIRFVRMLIQFRKNVVADPDDEGLTLSEELRAAKINWHGTRLNQPDWSADSHTLAMTLEHKNAGKTRRLTHFIFNAYWETLDFNLPPLPPGATWHRLLDTNLAPPDDISSLADALPIEDDDYRVANRSVVVLCADLF